MDFEIDVSGPDIFERNYTIIVAASGNDKIMLAHKFTDEVLRVIKSRHGQGFYRYPNSRKGRADLKVRLYCATIFHLLKGLKRRYKLKEVNLDICRDFSGNEADIKQSLRHLLGEVLGLSAAINFVRLPKESVADKYAFLVRHDACNKLKRIRLEIGVVGFEEFLKKAK